MGTLIPDLPPGLLKVIADFLARELHGTITMNFTEGRMVNYEAKIHSILRGWPQSGDSRTGRSTDLEENKNNRRP